MFSQDGLWVLAVSIAVFSSVEGDYVRLPYLPRDLGTLALPLGMGDCRGCVCSGIHNSSSEVARQRYVAAEQILIFALPCCQLGGARPPTARRKSLSKNTQTHQRLLLSTRHACTYTPTHGFHTERAGICTSSLLQSGEGSRNTNRRTCLVYTSLVQFSFPSTPASHSSVGTEAGRVVQNRRHS